MFTKMKNGKLKFELDITPEMRRNCIETNEKGIVCYVTHRCPKCDPYGFIHLRIDSPVGVEAGRRMSQEVIEQAMKNLVLDVGRRVTRKSDATKIVTFMLDKFMIVPQDFVGEHRVDILRREKMMERRGK